MGITINGSSAAGNIDLGTNGTIADLAVGGVPDGTIDRDALAADVIDGTKLADDAVAAEHVADDAVGVAQLSASGTASSSTFLRGDNAWAAAGGGILLQVEDTLESDEVLVSTQATWTDLDTSLTITPTDATTKMIIWTTVQGIWKNATCNWLGVQLVGSATGMTTYTRKLEWIYGYWTTSGENSPVINAMGPVSTQVVHDHNTTNPITYKLQGIVYDHSDDEATFMAWGNDNNTTSATIVVQEFST